MTVADTAAPATVPAALTVTNVSAFVLAMVGELDRRAANRAGGEAADGQAAAGYFDLDLAPLTSFDSAAIAGLVALQRRAQARKLRMRVLNAAPNLRKLASLYAVDGLLFRD